MLGTAGNQTLPRLTIARVKAIVRAGQGASVALLLWGIFYPVPFHMLVLSCIVLPLLAAALSVWIKRASRWNESAKHRQDIFVMVVWMPLALLSGLAEENLNFLDWRIAAAWLLVAGACILGTTCWRSARVRGDWRIILLVALIAMGCSFGLLAFVNRELDPHVVRANFATIYDKEIHTSGGPKGGSIVYNVWVTPSPPGWTWIHVRRDIYWQLRRGQRACVVQGSGLLGIGWLEVRPCA